MSWRDQLRDGSFRGVPFKIQASRALVGRRGQVHEYPLRDKPYAEDLGRRARAFNVECFVLGADYMAQRDALIAALEQKGAGTLVHPYLGTRSVVVFDPAEIEESTREGGMARFRIPFRESGKKLEPTATADTSSLSQAAAATTSTAAVQSFARNYALSGMPQWVSNSAIGDLSALAQTIDRATQSLPGIPSFASQFEQQLGLFSSSLTSLVQTPFNVGASVASLLLGIGRLVQQPFDALNLYSGLSSYGTPPSSVPATPARIQEAANRAALNTLVQAIATSCMVAAVSQIPNQTTTRVAPKASSFASLVLQQLNDAVPASITSTMSGTSAATSAAIASAEALLATQSTYLSEPIPTPNAVATTSDPVSVTGFDTVDAALSTRDMVTGSIDAVMLAADDELYPTLADLNAAFVTDIDARVATLPLLTSFTPAMTLPGLVLAWRLYADATRDADIVARNSAIYPGFLSGGDPLEVLSA